MYDNTNAIGFETIYNHAADFLDGLCPHCKEPVKELYPDKGILFEPWICGSSW
jgi:hypothetical protein